MDLKDQKESLDFRAPKGCWVNLGQGAKRSGVLSFLQLNVEDAIFWKNVLCYLCLSLGKMWCTW